MKITIHTDGGARGNPGPAAIGYVIETCLDGKRASLVEGSSFIGHATNNVAEYTAVKEALSAVSRLPAGKAGQPSVVSNKEKISIDCYLDSLLVASQLSGIYKTKEPRLRRLLLEVHMVEAGLGGGVAYHAISREQNKRADALVNQALDKTVNRSS